MLAVIIVEDNEKLRAALKSGLNATGKVQVSYDCASGEDALDFCRATLPSAVLMDVQLAR